jgi:flagellar basal-body rod protein FlgG
MPIQAIYTSASSMQAQAASVDNSANNLANLNTTGFKSTRVEFQDLFYQTLRAAGAQGAAGVETPVGIQVGLGVAVSAVSGNFAQGALEETGRDLDVGIDGLGFLRVLLPNGEVRYTRDGGLEMTSTGRLVTPDGYPVGPGITIPPGSLSVQIGIDGTVSVEPAAAPGTWVVVGQLQLSRFVNPEGLARMGRNLYAQTAASGAPITGTPGSNGLGTLRQGSLESSNVDVVSDLVELITAQRAFTAATRVIQVGSEMLQTANEIFR